MAPAPPPGSVDGFLVPAGALLGPGRGRAATQVFFPQKALDLRRNGGIFLQKLDHVGLALADLVALVAVPGAGLVDETLLDPHVHHLPEAVDALAIEDLELTLPEGRRHLVLDHLDPGLVADHFLALLDRADAADIEAHRGVELEGVAAGGGFRAAEHHPDLHAD